MTTIKKSDVIAFVNYLAARLAKPEEIRKPRRAGKHSTSTNQHGDTGADQ